MHDLVQLTTTLSMFTDTKYIVNVKKNLYFRPP